VLLESLLRPQDPRRDIPVDYILEILERRVAEEKFVLLLEKRRIRRDEKSHK
jgi:hypothetical protein